MKTYGLVTFAGYCNSRRPGPISSHSPRPRQQPRPPPEPRPLRPDSPLPSPRAPPSLPPSPLTFSLFHSKSPRRLGPMAAETQNAEAARGRAKPSQGLGGEGGGPGPAVGRSRSPASISAASLLPPPPPPRPPPRAASTPAAVPGGHGAARPRGKPRRARWGGEGAAERGRWRSARSRGFPVSALLVPAPSASFSSRTQSSTHGPRQSAPEKAAISLASWVAPATGPAAGSCSFPPGLGFPAGVG